VSQSSLDRLPVRVDGEIRLLPLTEVIYCYANGNRTVVVTAGGELSSHAGLRRLAERLEPWGFFRCHRAYVVNLGHIRSVIPWTRNAYSLLLEGNREIPLSKHRVTALRRMLDW
jgi:ABC-2 type transport system ATP-binding protein